MLLPEPGFLYGLARLPNEREVPCGTCIIREPDGSDWLDLLVPLGGLGLAYPVAGYPFTPGSELPPWQADVDGWLSDIAHHLFACVPFSLALVGWEVSGSQTAMELRQAGLPSTRYIGYLIPEGTSLAFFPANAR